MQQAQQISNLTHCAERLDFTAAFRRTAHLNMHEAAANHFSLGVNDDGTRFLMNPNQCRFCRIKASGPMLPDASDPATMEQHDTADPPASGVARFDPVARAPCALRDAFKFDPRDRAGEP